MSKVENLYTLRRILIHCELDRELVIKELGKLIADKSLNKNIDKKTLAEWQEYIQSGMNYNELPW